MGKTKRKKRKNVDCYCGSSAGFCGSEECAIFKGKFERTASMCRFLEKVSAHKVKLTERDLNRYVHIGFARLLLVGLRDGLECAKCGSVENLSLDHIIPRKLGGHDDYDNYQILCRSCNSTKGATTIDYRVAIKPHLKYEKRINEWLKANKK